MFRLQFWLYCILLCKYSQIWHTSNTKHFRWEMFKLFHLYFFVVLVTEFCLVALAVLRLGLLSAGIIEVYHHTWCTVVLSKHERTLTEEPECIRMKTWHLFIMKLLYSSKLGMGTSYCVLNLLQGCLMQANMLIALFLFLIHKGRLLGELFSNLFFFTSNMSWDLSAVVHWHKAIQYLMSPLLMGLWFLSNVLLLQTVL